jgi:hypothetical protein
MQETTLKSTCVTKVFLVYLLYYLPFLYLTPRIRYSGEPSLNPGVSFVLSKSLPLGQFVSQLNTYTSA